MDLINVLDGILELAVENHASDIHIRAGKPAILRINGQLQVIEMEGLSREQVFEILKYLEAQQPGQRRMEGALQKDFALLHPQYGRFRVNAFYERSVPALAFRRVKSHIPSLQELQLPTEPMRSLIRHSQGLILVSGATGSGKSTTLAALLNDMNQTTDNHVVTLEDPIEYLFEDNLSVFTQREVGIDTEDFPQGLRSALRQDPDIIMIGELRDAETFRVALQAAETGHLVISTTHAANSFQTMERILEFYEPSYHEVILRRLSENLRGVISQKLLPGMDGKQIPVMELFKPGPGSRQLIRDADFSKIQDLLEEAGEDGSFSFTADFHRLVSEAKITKGIAMEYCPNPRALEMRLKGIVLNTGKIIQ